ncbi:DUF2533 family protein [Bacillus alveayuensis]|uniref:DUF2533 family protein n=1 Tax=Aeribacillus alveayuensis TaxID=279215 RepID=A0ABT9VP92_9BACI|nr:DUF2533 family protein [Bacillus alveayuensis]MDQ0162803.1 hypothetical protein [Bacillus alveayuensis]
MTEVHKEITKHSNRQHQLIKSFIALERMREEYIDEAVQRCLQNKPFSVDKINAVTEEINQLAKEGIIPTRKHVTIEMVKEYVQRKFQHEV